MPNEIYHRSNWGESKAEGFGDVYYDHAATNKLYNHSDYYENSDGTDATLKDLNNKASIVLTPTAYSDGSLNTVIPPYAPSYIEDVAFVTSEWNLLQQGWSIDETNKKLVAEATWTGSNIRAQYLIPEIIVGKTVKFSFDVVVTAGKFHFNSPFSSSSVGYGSPDFINQSGSYSFTFVASGTSVSFRNKTLDFAGEITNIKVEVIEEADFDFSRGSSATRVNEQGLVEDSQGDDYPRIDFTDGTGSLLFEPQSTNLLERSNEFDNSYWGKQNVTVTANSAISPDGTNNAFLLDVGTANVDHSLRKAGLAPTATYTVSIFAKKGSTDYVWFLCGGASKGVQAIFDLSDGSVTDSGTVGSGQTLVAAKSVDMGNGWYRLIMEAETTAAPANNLTITPYYQDTFSGNITTSWQGNNETIYIYGAMNEENSFSTSYIPTESASVTRSADVANNSGNADLFNDSEGVLYAEIAALADDLTFRSISISSDAGYNNSIMIRYISTSNQVNVITRIGSAINNTSVTVNDITEFNKIAFKYKSEDCDLFINGVKVASSAGAFSSSGINNLSFDRGDGTADFYGKVKCVAVFKEALTDEQLEKLTS